MSQSRDGGATLLVQASSSDTFDDVYEHHKSLLDGAGLTFTSDTVADADG